MIGAKRKFKRDTYALAAGERLPVSIVASWFTVIAASKAFEVGIDNEDPQPIEAGLAINTDGYEKMVLRNPHGEPISVDVAFTSNELRDSRLTASGVVNVAQTGPVNVTPTGTVSVTPTGVVSVLETGARNLTSQGGAVREIGASYAVYVGLGTIEVVSAAANTNGVTLNTSTLMVQVAGGAATLSVGGKVIAAQYELGVDNLDEYYVPPGQAVSVSLSASAYLYCTYTIH